MSMDKDVTINLPVTRRQLFKFAYRRYLGFLIKLSLLLCLFAIPLMLVYILKGSISGQILNEFTNENIVKYLNTEVYTDLLYIPSLVIFFIRSCGCIYFNEAICLSRRICIFKVFLFRN